MVPKRTLGIPTLPTITTSYKITVKPPMLNLDDPDALTVKLIGTKGSWTEKVCINRHDRTEEASYVWVITKQTGRIKALRLSLPCEYDSRTVHFKWNEISVQKMLKSTEIATLLSKPQHLSLVPPVVREMKLTVSLINQIT
ncbi:hypothetical protein FGIG_08917 [Fasciola gigantica]|uniref:Uncharacterized protein n=1 Tax=Fasciola gigantica TaxID=46835 RepID=A0A504Y447_FASGI|nr:hypothetical protein FGIG_08917 [Fasciola gigantica]